MSIWDTVAGWAKNLGDSALNAVNGFNQSMGTIAGYLNSFVSASLQFFSNPIAGVDKAAADLSALESRVVNAIYGAIARQEQFIVQKDLAPFESWAKRQFTFTDQLIWSNFYALWRLIYQVDEQEHTWALQQFTIEKAARIRGDAQSEAYTRQRVQWALGLVQQAAASGYQATMPGRQDVLMRLVDDIATRDPLLRELVGRVAQGILDLAAIDDPILRIGLGFVIRDIIDKLGIDRAMGDLLGALLDDILGQRKPDNLHDVILSIGNRLNALEGQWETFMADGGPEILQAGTEWKNITSILTDIGLAAFFGTMVADPTAWANDISEAAGPVVDAGVAAFTDIMRLWR